VSVLCAISAGRSIKIYSAVRITAKSHSHNRSPSPLPSLPSSLAHHWVIHNPHTIYIAFIAFNAAKKRLPALSRLDPLATQGSRHVLHSPALHGPTELQQGGRVEWTRKGWKTPWMSCMSGCMAMNVSPPPPSLGQLILHFLPSLASLRSHPLIHYTAQTKGTLTAAHFVCLYDKSVQDNDHPRRMFVSTRTWVCNRSSLTHLAIPTRNQQPAHVHCALTLGDPAFFPSKSHPLAISH
jgi:hypothetical protein